MGELRWQVWAVQVAEEGAAVVREDAAEGDAKQDAGRRNLASARIMPGAPVVFMALPAGQVPSLQDAQRLLAGRVDGGVWKVWEVAPDAGRVTVLGSGGKEAARRNARLRNTIAASQPVLAGVVFMALPDGQAPGMDQARQLLTGRGGDDAAGTAREQLLDPARARRALDTYRAVLREAPDGDEAGRARAHRLLVAADAVAAELDAALHDLGWGLAVPVPGHPLSAPRAGA